MLCVLLVSVVFIFGSSCGKPALDNFRPPKLVEFPEGVEKCEFGDLQGKGCYCCGGVFKKDTGSCQLNCESTCPEYYNLMFSACKNGERPFYSKDF